MKTLRDAIYAGCLVVTAVLGVAVAVAVLFFGPALLIDVALWPPEEVLGLSRPASIYLIGGLALIAFGVIALRPLYWRWTGQPTRVDRLWVPAVVGLLSLAGGLFLLSLVGQARAF